MPNNGSPMVSAAAAAPAPAGAEDQAASWPRYRRSRRRPANESASHSEPEESVDAQEHQLDSLA
jgi:hypothetical protein